MKALILSVAVCLVMYLSTGDANCQIRNLLKKTEQEASKAINKSLGEGLNNIFNKDGETQEEEGTDSSAQPQSVDNDASEGSGRGEGTATAVAEKAPGLVWAKYDFVPGEKIILEDNLEGEENGEFPSRWDLVQGSVENAVYGDENVIMFRGGSPTIVPYLKNPDIDYLPDVFTIEFDLLLPNNSFTVYLWDRKNQATPSGGQHLQIWSTRMDMGIARSNLPGGENITDKWVHIAIAYTSGKMKAYIDETRLINIPHMEFNPSGISLHAYHASDQSRFYIKNFRLAEGGVKYYDRFLQDGKIVSNGIRFDTGKASLKPESMGVLNEIYMMLSEHPDIQMSIEGHTDSDGDADLNQTLSEERALAVKEQLVAMGISSERLVSKGFGESKPVDSNERPEGKAANRRVEFVKLEDAG